MNAEPKGPATAALAGVVIGFDNVARAVALSALVFAGAMAGGGAIATALFLVTGVAATLVLAFGPRLPGPVFSGVQNAPVAIMLPALAAVTARAELAGGPDAAALSIFLLLGGAAIAAGLAMMALSAFDLGRFVRLMPYPVAAGFLAATGALLMRSALQLVYPEVVVPTPETVLVPALAIGFALLLGLSAWTLRNGGMVLALLLGVIGTHVALWTSDTDLSLARALGLLQTAQPVPALITPDALRAALSAFDPETLGIILPTVAAAVLISLLGVSLNMTGAELVLHRDIDSRAAMMRSGIVNLLSGAAGSTVSYTSASNTVTAHGLGARGRLPIWTMCAMLLAFVPFARDLYLYIPHFISAGLLLYIGGAIVNTWLLEQFRRLRLADWCISLLIVLISLTLGMATAVGFGIVAASLIFAVAYARLPMIRASTDLRARRSTVDRGPAQTAWLDLHGHEVALVSLQGFLFFGSVVRLTTHIRALLERDTPPRTVILDFSRVSRVDAAAIAAIRKLELLAATHEGRIVLAALNPAVGAEFERSGLVFGADLTLSRADDADSALQAEEERLLARDTSPASEETALGALSRMIDDPQTARRLLDLLDRERLAPGEVLIRQGDRAGDVFIIDSGTMGVHIRMASGRVMRLRVLRSGALVGEIASYAGLPRTADVIAETEAVVYRASEERMREIAAHSPELAATLHRIVAATLAERLDRTNKLLGDLT